MYKTLLTLLLIDVTSADLRWVVVNLTEIFWDSDFKVFGIFG